MASNAMGCSTSGLLAVGVTLTLFCLYQSAFVPQESVHPITAETRYGVLRGTRRNISFSIEGGTTTVIDEFLNVPYAAPPVGDLRFRAPALPKPWEGERDATAHGWVCPQGSSYNTTVDAVQNEDCLYLSIYSPFQADNPNKLYPVMFFIHGGSYEYGTGNRYNGSALAQNGVVLVSINYRLAALGFLSAASPELPGNLGIRDHIAALTWVRQNIRIFRGDPDSVTIFGSSAGGASVGLLMMSPLAKGLFHRVIAQSGTANAMWATSDIPVELLQRRFKALARNLNCVADDDYDLSEVVDCLRRKPTQDLKLEYICKFIECLGVDPPMKPVVDGEVLPDTPLNLLRAKRYHSVPYMAGTVRAEFGEYYSTDFPKDQMVREVGQYLRRRYGIAMTDVIKFHYTDWSKVRTSESEMAQVFRQTFNSAEVLTDMGLVAPVAQMARHLAENADMAVYSYYLDNYESYHSVELNYVFGTPFTRELVDEMERLTDFSPLDTRLSVIFMKIWTDFAKNGVPSSASDLLAANWTPTTMAEENYLHITADGATIAAEMRTKYKAQQAALWNILASDIAGMCHQSAAPTTCDHSKTWVFFGIVVGLILTLIILLCAIIWSHRGLGTSRENSYALLRRGSSQKSGAYGLVL